MRGGGGGVGVKGVWVEFEPHQVEMEMELQGQKCEEGGDEERAEQSKWKMGSMRGRGAWLADCVGEMNVYGFRWSQ